jgi:NADH-quinone oxidoreductase E subunit
MNSVPRKTFAFTPENLEAAKKIIAKYPAGRQASAVMPLLAIAQKQNDNLLTQAELEYVADMLGMAPIRVHEVASFYTMYNLKPAGKVQVQVCTTTPCWLRGSDDIVEACHRKLGIGIGETTADGEFTLIEAECLGACVNAPIVWIGDDFYEDLDGPKMEQLLDAFRRGQPPKPGPMIDRQTSAPVGGKTTLKDI